MHQVDMREHVYKFQPAKYKSDSFLLCIYYVTI